MKRLLLLASTLTVLALPDIATAQGKYDKFVGEWVAAVLVANACPGIMAVNEQRAADVARSQEGLRRQKVLKLLFYSKTTALEAVGRSALMSRELDPSNKMSLCRFGRDVAGTPDSIGRFLKGT